MSLPFHITALVPGLDPNGICQTKLPGPFLNRTDLRPVLAGLIYAGVDFALLSTGRTAENSPSIIDVKPGTPDAEEITVVVELNQSDCHFPATRLEKLRDEIGRQMAIGSRLYLSKPLRVRVQVPSVSSKMFEPVIDRPAAA